MRPWTLWYGSRKATPAAPASTFVPVQVTTATPAPIEIVLPEGVRVLVGADTPPTVVAAVVAAIRASC